MDSSLAVTHYLKINYGIALFRLLTSLRYKTVILLNLFQVEAF